MIERDHTARAGRISGATLLDVAIAIGLILIVASAVTGAVARTVLADARAQLTVQASGAVDAALAELASQVNVDLNAVAEVGLEQAARDGLVTLPDPCPQDTTRSCLKLGSATGQVTYTFSARTRTVAARRQVVTAELSAVVALPGGGTVTRSTTLYDAAAGLLAVPGTGAVRVQVDGIAAGDAAPQGIHLLRETSTGYTSVGAGAVGTTDRIALIAAAANQCTPASPCRVGLTGDAPYFQDGTFTLTGATVAGDAGKVVLTAGEVVDLTAPVVRPGRAEVELQARRAPSGTGQPDIDRPSRAGSVCLWASFTDPSGPVAIPACNAPSAGLVRFDSYAPDPGRPTATIGLPTGTPVRLTTEHPAGTCPKVPAQTTATAGGWSSTAASCTSWTWGEPSDLVTLTGTVATTPFRQAHITLPSGSASRYRAVWSGDTATPATGLAGHPLWSKPRATGACGADASCAPPGAGYAPELTVCPENDPYCLSATNLAPVVTAPQVGSGRVHTVAVPSGSSSHNFEVTVTDLEGDNITVRARLTDPPSGTGTGRLRRVQGGQPQELLATSWVSLGTHPGQHTFTFQYDQISHTTTTWLRRLEIELSDGTSTRVVPVAIHRGTLPWTITPETALVPQLAQGSTDNLLRYTLLGTDGESWTGTGTVASAETASGSRLRLSAAAGSTRQTVAPLPTAAPGRVDLRVHLDGAGSPGIPPAGTETITARIGAPGLPTSNPAVFGGDGQSVQTQLDVVSSAGGITLTGASSVRQGRTAQVTLTATDLSGAPLDGVAVSLAVTRDGASVRDVVLDTYRCVTAQGSCTVTVQAAPIAETGSYLLTAASGTATPATRTIEVQPSVATLASVTRPIVQGETGVITVNALTAALNPVAGVTVTGSANASGVTVTPATTDAAGAAAVRVAVGGAVPPGTVEVTLTADGVSRTVAVTVTPQPATVSVASAPDPIANGELGTAVLRVVDAGAQPLAGVRLTLTTDGGAVAVPRAVWTNTDGEAIVPISTRRPGTVTVTATTANGRSTSFTATVVPAGGAG